MFGFIILVITLLIAAAAVVLALKLPLQLQYWRFISGAIAIGLLLSAILYWQQMRALSFAAEDRERAVAAGSDRATTETAQRVTQEVGSRYEKQVAALTKKVADLEAQLPNQANRSDIVGGNTAAGNNTPAANGMPGIFWIQGDEAPGKGSAEVQFRVYGQLAVPAFIAVCDRPCRAVGGQAGAGSEGIAIVGSSDREVAGFIFKKPKPMPAGTEGTITLQSSGREPLRVTAFRILRDSEVPTNLK
jgi:hypothetical protein